MTQTYPHNPLRYSIRSFLKKPVSLELLKEIFEEVRSSASSKNTQPWQVQVLSGQSLETLREKSVEWAKAQIWCPHFPSPAPRELLPELYQRAKDCGISLFAHKGILKNDEQARAVHNLENFRFFQAPVVLFFFAPNPPSHENWVDLGQLLANTLNALQRRGLGACPQWSVQMLAQKFDSLLNPPPNYAFAFCVSVGYEDAEAHINHFRTPRLEVADFVSFKGF